MNPSESRYSTFGNNPIVFADPMGLYREKKARRKARRAERKGYEIGEVYKSGKEWGFNKSKAGSGKWGGDFGGKKKPYVPAAQPTMRAWSGSDQQMSDFVMTQEANARQRKDHVRSMGHFMSGEGGGLGKGFGSTMGTGIKQAPGVILPEMAVSKLASMYKAAKMAKATKLGGGGEGLSMGEFIAVTDDLMKPYSGGKNVSPLILGDDAAIIPSAFNQPTMPGILDVHMHGTEAGFFAYNTGGTWTLVSPGKLAQMIKYSHPNIKGVRLYTCFGAQCRPQAISNALGVPVLSSTNVPIAVGKPTLYLNSGGINLYLPQ